MSFADDIRLVPAGVDGSWEASLAERWNVGRNQNGGVLLATLSGAMGDVVGQPDPFAITGHYLAAVEAGGATVEASVVKPGRTYATASASLHQGERERVRAIGAFGDLAVRGEEGQSMLDAPSPTLPAPDACADLFDILVTGPAGEKTLTRSLRNFEIRVDPDGGWCRDGANLRGWIRLRDEDTVTTTMLVAIADAFPPTLLGVTEIGWLPTIELTVHVFGRPPRDEPWLRAELRTRSVIGGLLDEDGELWDASGRLVARFRQMALLIPRDR